MTESGPPDEEPVEIADQRDGLRRVEIKSGDAAISGCSIESFTLRVGRATVRMDGIGGVGTHEAHRNRGYARRVLDAAIACMTAGDAALSMLYGIPDLYPKFGYAVAGPDQYFELFDPFPTAMRSGWTARPFRPEDLPAVHALYERETSTRTGAAVRTDASRPYRSLLKSTGTENDSCTVVVGPDGHVAGYAWEGRQFWPVRNMLAPRYPDAFIVGEAIAEGAEAADALLAACGRNAVAKSARIETPVKRILLSLPPEGPVDSACMRCRGERVDRYSATGDSMVKVLDTQRLLRALAPELAARWSAAGGVEPERMTVRTDAGSATVRLAPDAAAVTSGGDGTAEVEMPAFTLGQLALGAFEPEDVLERLESRPEGRARELIKTLFPRRRPHMWIPDRY